ncbi:Fur family transcriptional regulator [Microtetraspora sp. NBRC 13810]|uniref:Fur family transcriptional regulator n=1 Tax=Microtetraspora sp. NBRC 13810 TaxID=3030990 RepID=UPI0033284C5E
MVDMAYWRTMLDGAGVRATRRRVLVLDVLAPHARPVTVGRLHAELRARGEQIGLTTVYRAVSSLVDAGLVHVFGRTGEAAYRLCDPARHHHLVCRVCGLVVERFGEDDLDGFLAEEVYGVCPLCVGDQDGTFHAGATAP